MTDKEIDDKVTSMLPSIMFIAGYKYSTLIKSGKLDPTKPFYIRLVPEEGGIFLSQDIGLSGAETLPEGSFQGAIALTRTGKRVYVALCKVDPVDDIEDASEIQLRLVDLCFFWARTYQKASEQIASLEVDGLLEELGMSVENKKDNEV